jgi:hypothetical protein
MALLHFIAMIDHIFRKRLDSHVTPSDVGGEKNFEHEDVEPPTMEHFMHAQK